MHARVHPYFQESSGLFQFVTPDQIALLFPMELMQGEGWRWLQEKGGITATQVGGHYLSIGLHPEIMLPWLPMLGQFGNWLAVLSEKGLFVPALWYDLHRIFHPAWSWYSPTCQNYFLELLEYYRIRWFRMEVAFDLQPGLRPFKVTDDAFASVKYGTIYLPPTTRQKRRRSKHGVLVTESKGRRDSLVAIYDRGEKTGQGSFIRFEVRLFSRHLKSFDLRQLYLPFWPWYVLNKSKIIKLMKRLVPKGTLGYEGPALERSNPWLLYLLRNAQW